MTCRNCITNDELGALGFPVEKREKSMGSEHIVRPGLSQREARRRAVAARLVDGLPCPACWARFRTPFVPKPPPKVDPEALAWFMAHRVTSIAELTNPA